jgi:hypothetical protein
MSLVLEFMLLLLLEFMSLVLPEGDIPGELLCARARAPA